MFEGARPETASLRLTGKSEERVGALAHGELVYLLVKANVAKVTHGYDADDLLVREHTLKASNVIILDAKDGARLLTEGQMLADERFGVPSLFAGVDRETGEVK